MTVSRKINYDYLVQESLRKVVQNCVKDASEKGLPGNHHFYISFQTVYPGVQIPEYLIEEYPDEITIVLQHEYWDLSVDEEGFEVTLCFNDIHETVYVPFGAIVNFVDPSVKFGLEFTPAECNEGFGIPTQKTTSKKVRALSSVKPDVVKGDEDGGNVIALDIFRKK